MPTPPKDIVHDDIDDDLDDLDDVLDKFPTNNPPPAPSSLPTSTTSTSASKPKTAPIPPPHSIPSGLDDLDDDDFAKELAKGMEDLMREITSASPATEGGGEDAASFVEQEKALKAAWEAMLVEGLNAGADSSTGTSTQTTTKTSAGPAPNAGTTTAGETDFQKTIRQTMEKMKSGEQNLRREDSEAAGVGGSPSSGEMDEFASLMASLQGASGEDESELTSFLETMMDQLMSKEVLYEPLCELRDKFPAYLSKHSTPTTSTPPPASTNPTSTDPPPSPADITRFKSQQRVIAQITTIFEDPNYHDTDNKEQAIKLRKQIVELMGELQSYGSPPAELMGPLPAGLGLGMPGLGEGAEGVPEGCCIS